MRWLVSLWQRRKGNDDKSNNFEIKSNNEIEEIAKIMCGVKGGCKCCMFSKKGCFEYENAVGIYNAGYHKQSEGEWIVKEDIFGGLDLYYLECSICGRKVYNIENPQKAIEYHKYCSNCGARMKGGE